MILYSTVQTFVDSKLKKWTLLFSKDAFNWSKRQ